MSEFPCPTLITLRGEVDKAGKPSVGVCLLDVWGVGGGGGGREAKWKKKDRR